jgi:hypothetical protein
MKKKRERVFLAVMEKIAERLIFSLWASRQRVKKELAVLTLTQEAYLKGPEGGMRNLTSADCTEALQQ